MPYSRSFLTALSLCIAWGHLLPTATHAAEQNPVVDALTKGVSKQVSPPESALAIPTAEEMNAPAKAKANVVIQHNALQLAIEHAYAANPRLIAQQKSFQSVMEQIPQAYASFLPNAAINYEKGRRRTRSGAGIWSYSDSSLKALSVTQPLFRGGSSYAGLKAAKRNVDAAMSRLKLVEQDVILQSITAFMDVVRAKAVLELSQKNRDVLARQLEAANQRFEVGEDTRTDVSQSQARLALAESDVIESQSQLATARAVYYEVVRMEAPENLDMPDALPAMPSSLQKLIDVASKHNPAVIEAEYLTTASDYNVDANMGVLLPSVNLEGSMTRQEGVGSFGLTDLDQDHIVISASMPLYAGGSNYSRIRAAKETHMQRKYELKDVQNRIHREAIRSWEEWKAATASIESNQSAVEAAEIALNGVRQEQQYGARTTLDVLDAERELFNANVQLVIAKRNRIVAAYSILQVMGELTARNLNLDVPLYDADEYYDDNAFQLIGF